MSGIPNSVLLTGYRVTSLIVGLAIVWMGYKLFRVGVYERAGELKAAWGEKRLELLQATPGSFFALFGAVVIAVSLYKGLTFTETTRLATPPTIPAIEDAAAERGATNSSTGPPEVERGASIPMRVGTGLTLYSILNKVLAGESLSPEERAEAQQLLIEIQKSWVAEVGESGDSLINIG